MNLAIQIEDAMIEANIIRDTLLAVKTAIYDGPNSYKEYELALYAVFIKADDHLKQMKALTDTAYALQRESGTLAVDKRQKTR